MGRKRTTKQTQTMRAILLEPRPVTRQYIRELKEEAGSWNNLARALRYSSKSSVIEAYAHPERITKRFVWRIREYELQREASLGHYHIVTLGDEITRIPKHIRFAQPFVMCKGHRVNVPCVDKNGFCDEECKELYLARQRKLRGPAPKRGK
jgi:hypothetical protein